jgi:hypothetical protein
MPRHVNDTGSNSHQWHQLHCRYEWQTACDPAQAQGNATMKRLICLTLGWLLIQATVIAGPTKDKGKDKGKNHSAKQAVHGDDRSGTRVGIHVTFGSGDVSILREHYAPRYRNLPPGLRKKVARGGELPPGWQKRYEPFPAAIERRLPPLSPEYRRGVFDGHAVIYNARTNVVIDVAVLF